MIRRLFSAAFLVSLVVVSSGAIAQDRNEIAVTFGRSFVSDQGVKGIVAFDTTLHFGNRFTLEANYGRRLLNLGIVGLTVEVPFVVTFHQDVLFDSKSRPKNYQAFFVTPSLRANLFPGAGTFSPWVSAGGGVGHFNENSYPGIWRPESGRDWHYDRSVSGRCRARCAACCEVSAYAGKFGTFTPAYPN